MAAQDYYNPGSTAPQSPYIQNDFQHGPPPPYAPFSASPIPQQRPQQSQPYQNLSSQQFQHDSKPQYPQGYQHSQSPYQHQPPQHSPYYPPQGQTHQSQPGAYPPQQFPQRPVEPSSGRPNSAGDYGTTPQRYSSSLQVRPQSQSPYPPHQRSRSRRRSQDKDRSRSRSGNHRRSRRGSSNKSRGAFDTFVGAGGGAIIGDAIFPGLGTVGGALLGGYGGHKVAKDKQRDADDLRRREHHMHRKHRSRDLDSTDSESDREGRRRH